MESGACKDEQGNCSQKKLQNKRIQPMIQDKDPSSILDKREFGCLQRTEVRDNDWAESKIIRSMRTINRNVIGAQRYPCAVKKRLLSDKKEFGCRRRREVRGGKWAELKSILQRYLCAVKGAFFLKLRRAAEEGDTNALYECILRDPNVLRSFDNYEFVDTPLHIAAAGGHADFAMAILNLKPSFGRKLNQNVYSPIHLALQNGHEATVLRLLEADKDSVHVKGKEGYTVLHQAAERGNVQLLVEFLKHCPTSIEDVTNRNETAFHIAAKNYRFEALELLARWLQRRNLYSKVSRKHLFNIKDTVGNAVLHIAAFPIQPQMIKVLVECGADRMATNMNGMTALDIVTNQSINTQDRAISLEILRHGDFSRFMTGFKRRGIKPLNELLRSKISFLERVIVGSKLTLLNLSAERINVLLVVLALILTATFQVVHSPPGGVWQGEADQAAAGDVDYSLAGSSVMNCPDYYAFVALNFSLFAVTSVFTIALLELVVGSFIMILVEILLSSFSCCFLFAVLVIDPSTDVEITSRQLPLYFLAMIVIMEIGKCKSMCKFFRFSSIK